MLVPDQLSDRIRVIFDRALQLQSDERMSLLESECRDEPELRAEIERLLQSDQLAEETSFLSQSSADDSGCPLDLLMESNIPEGTRLGAYELRQCVGKGGMGAVYRAVRVNDYQQDVAIKLVRTIGQTSDSVARFQAERQVLAKLNHTCITRLLDGGTTSTGQPYLVMEYVDGKPIDRYCEVMQTDLSQRLHLVIQICQAVEYIHQFGIVHRDIKPGNVLVTQDGVPKLTDFGLAKDLTNPVYQTQTGEILGTPAYMAPEQASGNDVGDLRRIDVYSLGALLYRLLVDRAPFTGTSFHEVLNQVVHGEPMLLRRLQPGLALDLEAVCLKAMEKDPIRRYASPADLADDLERFLAGKPVKARRITRLQIAWRWCRRNPTLTSMIGAVVSIVSVGTLLVGYFAVQESARAQQLMIANRSAQESAIVATRHAAKETEARREAELASHETQLARNIAEDRRMSGEVLAYAGRIASAQLAWQANDIAGARRSLEESNVALRGWEHDYLSSIVRNSESPLAIHPGGAASVFWTADGANIATSGRDGLVRLWHAKTGKLLQTIEHSAGVVPCVVMTPDNQYIVSGCENGDIRVWDVMTRNPVRTMKHQAAILSLALSRNGNRVISASRDGTVKVWEFETGDEVARLSAGADSTVRALLNADGTIAATAGGDRIVRIWDVATQTVKYASERIHRSPIQALAWTSIQYRLATADRDGEIIVWDAASCAPLTRFRGHDQPVHCLQFTRDGKSLISAGADQIIRAWNASSSKCFRSWRGHEGPIFNLAMSPNGNDFATASADGKVIVWNLQRDLEFQSHSAHASAIGAVAINADGTVVVTAGHDSTARVWDRKRRFAPMIFKERKHVFCVAISPDDKTIASGGGEGVVHLWDTETGNAIGTLDVHNSTVWSLAFSPDGKFLAAGTEGCAIGVFELATKSLPFKLTGHHRTVTSLTFTPDSRCLLSGSHDGTVRIWNLPSGDLIAQTEPLGLPVLAVATSPNSECFAAALGNPFEFQLGGGIVVGQINDATIRRRIQGHSKPVTGIAFTSDGKRIISGSQDRTIRFWDASSGIGVCTLITEPVLSLSISENGEHLATTLGSIGDMSERGSVQIRSIRRELFESRAN